MLPCILLIGDTSDLHADIKPGNQPISLFILSINHSPSSNARYNPSLQWTSSSEYEANVEPPQEVVCRRWLEGCPPVAWCTG